MDLMAIEPQKISKDVASYTTLLYGTPKAGKTTFYFEMFGNKAIFARTEKGSKAIGGLLGQDIASWSDFMKFKKQLQRKEVRERYNAVVIDTFDNLCIYLEKFIKNKYQVDKLNDAAGGWGAGQKEFTELLLTTLNEIESYGYTIHFISHATKSMEKIPGTETEFEKFYPAATKRGMEVATKMVDFILFAYLAIDPETKQERRVLYTRETMSFQAGGRFKNIRTGIPFSAESYNKALSEAIDMEDPIHLKDEKESNSLQSDELDFDAMMSESTKIAVALHKEGRIAEVTAVVEKHFGVGKLLKEATEKQAEVVAVVLEELRSL